MIQTGTEFLPDSRKVGLQYGVGILGTGMYVPEQVITNQYWEERLDTNDQWIVEKTGIVERRHMKDGETTSDMCVSAAREALERAGIRAAQLDAIIVATITPDYPLPSTALIIKEQLGATNAIPLDLTQVACAGIVYGMYLGVHLLQNRTFNNVLVIGADALSRIYNPNDRGSCIFFGDACGALVLHRTADPAFGVLSWDIDAKLNMDAVGVPHGGAVNPINPNSYDQGEHYLFMKGRQVWEAATTALPQTLNRSIAKIGFELDDIDYFILHQANARLVKEVLDRVGVEEERTLFNVHKYGNTGAGTMPTVLHEAITSDKLSNGDIIAFAGIGAGFKWGSMILRYTDNPLDFE